VRKTLSIILFLFIFAAFPGTVSAADVVPQRLLISLWPEYNNNQVFFMQQVTIPNDTPLPATVRFAFPSGTQMQWTGEILGADPSKDKQATPTVTPKDGYDEVSITLTKSRIGQAEAIWDGLKIEGQNRSIALKYVQRYGAAETVFEFLEPSQSSDVVMLPKPTGSKKSPEGFNYYQTAPKNVPVGQAVEFNITYTRAIDTPSATGQKAAGQTPPANAGKDPFSPAALALTFLVAGAGIAAFFYMDKKKRESDEKTKKKKAQPVRKTKAASAKKAAPDRSKMPIFIIIGVAVILGGIAFNAFSGASNVPSGTNCGENKAYLQKGVDEYKKAWGVSPANLKQLLESKDNKGPFVETVSLKCPTEGTYYKVENGIVVQGESTAAPS